MPKLLQQIYLALKEQRNKLVSKVLLFDVARLSSIDSRPGATDLLLAFCLAPHQLTLLLRRFRASRLDRGDAADFSAEGIPTIEALIVAAAKDFSTLPYVLDSIQFGSNNPVTKVTVITRNTDMEECLAIATSKEHLFPKGISVLDEDNLVPERLRKEVKEKFQRRYGWILQQLLTVKFVLDSEAAGLLVLDADTVLLGKRTWLQFDGSQPLLVSSEFNKPYYLFLNKLFQTPQRPKFTHVTHHMLMQPALLRAVLKSYKIESIDDIGLLVLEHADCTTASSISLDFELYAQLSKKHFPERVKMIKFGNLGVACETTEISNSIQTLATLGAYKSLSFHSYLRASNAP